MLLSLPCFFYFLHESFGCVKVETPPNVDCRVIVRSTNNALKVDA